MGSKIKKIVLFASGKGTNADNIISNCQRSSEVEVVTVFCNRPHAGVYAVGEKYNVPVQFITKQALYETETVLKKLKKINPDLIVLAGFMALIPSSIVNAFPQRIINIHPALLPKYGGKGMYGMHVHEKVKATGDRVTGITIHYVNEYYDKGDIILQAKCPVSLNDSLLEILHNVQALERACYPLVIFELLGIKNDVTS